MEEIRICKQCHCERREAIRIFLCVVILSFPWGSVYAQREERPSQEEIGSIQVYLTEEEALSKMFANADSVSLEEHILSDEEKKEIEGRLGWRLEQNRFKVSIGWSKGKVAGYAMIANQIGMYRPITFIVKVDPEGKIANMAIMVYRESRGGEVKRKRFLHQFFGKSSQSKIRMNRDIINITGATLSVRAVIAGTKRVLTLIDELYLREGNGASKNR